MTETVMQTTGETPVARPPAPSETAPGVETTVKTPNAATVIVVPHSAAFTPRRFAVVKKSRIRHAGAAGGRVMRVGG